MGAKAYAGVAALIFTIIAGVQFARAAMGFDIAIAGFLVPIYMSIIAGVVASILAASGFVIARS